MTDPHHPPHHSDPLDPLDALASAHLDGATTPDEAARVASDPELAARVARLASARDALRATTHAPVDAAQREAAIDAALSAFSALTPLEGVERERTGAIPLVRPHRSRPRTRTLQLIGVAAAVVALALTVPLLDRLGSDSSDDTASSSFDATAGSPGPMEGGAGGGGSVADSAGDRGGSDGAPAADLGAFADLEALRGEVRNQLGGAKTSTTAAPATAAAGGESAPEHDQTCAPPAGDPVVYVARATLDGQPVTVVVREDDAGQRTLVVLDAACGTLSEAPL